MKLSCSLESLAAALRASPAFAMKRDIQAVAQRLGGAAESLYARAFPGAAPRIRNGDDAAAVPDGSGYILVAAEGMLPAFVQRDPYFAGFCSIMVNVSDIAAMGGRPLAVVDVVFRGPDLDLDNLMRGMADAARCFGVPVVGGHTSRLEAGSALAVAIVGRAQALITSFDARPGQVLMLAIDSRGSFRGDSLNFDAASGRAPEELRALTCLPAELAEAGLVSAGKDISMAGIVGTTLMLLEGSGVGARLDLARVACPDGVPAERWLRAFFSCGFVFSVEPAHAGALRERFAARGVSCVEVGEVCARPVLTLAHGAQECAFWDLREQSFTGFGAEARVGS